MNNLKKAIKALKKSKPPITLAEDDNIVFYQSRTRLKLNYTVSTEYVHNVDGQSNRRIFEELKIATHTGNIRGPKELYEFCTKAYGYKAGQGDWPTCKKEDIAALSRLMNQLIIEARKQGWTVHHNYIRVA